MDDNMSDNQWLLSAYALQKRKNYANKYIEEIVGTAAKQFEEGDFESVAKFLAEKIYQIKKVCDKGLRDNEGMRIMKGYDPDSGYMFDSEEIEDYEADGQDEVYSTIKRVIE